MTQLTPKQRAANIVKRWPELTRDVCAGTASPDAEGYQDVKRTYDTYPAEIEQALEAYFRTET